MSLLQNRKRVEHEDLSGVFRIIERLKTLSGNAQLDYLREYKDTKHLKEILYYTYCPDLQYKVKEDRYNKVSISLEKSTENGSLNWTLYKQYLDKFAGQKGVKESEIENLITTIYMCPIFKEILFKDLRIGMDIKSFNKVWDDFYVRPSLMLAEEFKGEIFENAMFSRKLDGRRGYYLNGKFYSINHKEYKTSNIQHILDDIKKIDPDNNYVFDGEFVYIDKNGKEDFSKSGIVTRDNYTNESNNIRFVVFYVLDKNEFIEEQHSTKFSFAYELFKDILKTTKYTETQELIETMFENIYLVRQYKKAEFDNLLKRSKELNWEGLMMLDGNKTYQHKRTKYLQKIKEMKDKEFEIVDMNLGKGRFSSTLGYITIKLPTGERVDVGSGFTDSQRDELWGGRDLILNSKIPYFATIKYFEETVDKDGKKSLRFPVFKGLRNAKGEDI
jgi:DNA ligase-1